MLIKLMMNKDLLNPTVLIIDDDEDARTILGRFVSQAAMRALTAETAKKGLAALLKETVDVVLLDLVMPEIDGLQALREMRNSREAADIPVIVVTVWDDPEIAAKAKALGAEDFLVKPVFRRTLVSTVRRQLEARCKN